MVKAVFDTNVLIDFLNAIPEAREEFSRYDEKTISIISWMEVMIGAHAEVETQTRAFLDSFFVIELDNNIAARAVELRRKYRVKLPDAIIWASADLHSMLLVTRNTKDFPDTTPGIRIPYIL
jgi:predicted nucleic acid-binding protein